MKKLSHMNFGTSMPLVTIKYPEINFKKMTTHYLFLTESRSRKSRKLRSISYKISYDCKRTYERIEKSLPISLRSTLANRKPKFAHLKRVAAVFFFLLLTFK